MQPGLKILIQQANSYLRQTYGEVASVAVSPDGEYLAIGSHVHPQSNVTISPDGHLLASSSNKIKIWQI
ncbi:hypothetical protein B7486_30770 [cyanobacterium TDX16]|nr:hypothetical protein B7486_30770 [cyanobacterium TDX16]